MKFKKISTSILLPVLVIILMIAYVMAKNHKQGNKDEDSITKVDSAIYINNQALKDIKRQDIQTFHKSYLLGKFDPTIDTAFELVDMEYTTKPNSYLRKPVYKAFIKMFYAAKSDGIRLPIVSATRNFNYQKNIWEQKWNGSRSVEGKNLATTIKDPKERAEIILKYSSMPGTSRHHWGTDIDLISVDPAYFEKSTGKKEYEWLLKNATRYGFCQPYTTQSIRKTGYQEEKWHWSYMPLSVQFLEQYKEQITNEDIVGFAGCGNAIVLDVIKNYVLSIDSACIPKINTP